MKIPALETVGKFPDNRFSWGESDGNMGAWFLVQGGEGTVGTRGHHSKLSSAPLKPPFPLKCRGREWPTHRSWWVLEVAQSDIYCTK